MVSKAPLISRLRAPAVCVSGVLYVLCFPSFNQGQLAWVAFVPFLLAVPGFSWRNVFTWSFVAGWMGGLGLLYWVYPTCRWGGVNPAVSVLAVGALSAYVALFWGLFGVIVKLFSSRPVWERPFWAALGWTALEGLRGHLFTGFPWLSLSCSQWQVPRHLPLAEMGGSYAVSFLIVLFNGTVAALVQGLRSRPKRWFAVGPGFLALVGLTVWSVYLWRRPLTPSGPPVEMALVQGNIDQYKKWDNAYEADIVRSYSTLTRRASQGNPTLVIWPETAVPGWIPNDAHHTSWIQDQARDSNTHLLVGAVSRQNDRDYNAAFLLSPRGEFVGQYLKIHLVPFGEYVPLRGGLARFVRVLNDLGSFDSGGETSVLSVPGTKVGVTICFEGLFPDLVRRFTLAGAQVLVNITNDGWYRHTAAPEQHFAASVLRAVENRRWVARAANTGYSGFVSPRGEVTGRTTLLEPAVLIGHPAPLDHLTFYVRFGDVFLKLCALFLFLGILFLGKQKRKS
ncbi:MAG: apolipoprotein N-acyltransferase [Elusimicrobia bacterium]|nr:apolipoprotein N-acyltransferase [Elusimicrobiota bacterium]